MRPSKWPKKTQNFQIEMHLKNTNFLFRTPKRRILKLSAHDNLNIRPKKWIFLGPESLNFHSQILQYLEICNLWANNRNFLDPKFLLVYASQKPLIRYAPCFSSSTTPMTTTKKLIRIKARLNACARSWSRFARCSNACVRARMRWRLCPLSATRVRNVCNCCKSTRKVRSCIAPVTRPLASPPPTHWCMRTPLGEQSETHASGRGFFYACFHFVRTHFACIHAAELCHTCVKPRIILLHMSSSRMRLLYKPCHTYVNAPDSGSLLHLRRSPYLKPSEFWWRLR